jgi:hypothetical protein
MSKPQSWTPDAIDYVRALAKEGKSGTQIASALGRTRCSVLGACFRNGIKISRGRVYRGSPNRPKPEPVPEAKPLPAAPVASPLGILVHELTNHTCRWPVHDTLPGRYCGAHTDAGSYCEHHHARAYRGLA